MRHSLGCCFFGDVTDRRYEIAQKLLRGTYEAVHNSYTGYHGELDFDAIGKTWAIIRSTHRDDTAAGKRTFERVAKVFEARFPNDVSVERFRHWAVGWVEYIFVRILDDSGAFTQAGKAAIKHVARSRME